MKAGRGESPIFFIFNERIYIRSTKPTIMKPLLAAIFVTLLSTCTPKQEQVNSTTSEVTSTTEKNKEMLRSAFSEVINKKNYILIDSFFETNIFDHGAFEGQQQGLQGFKKAVIEFLSTFSQAEVKIEDIVAEGDIVSTRETWNVTRATDNKVLTGETMYWFRLKEGKITEEWSKGWEWVGM